MIKNVSQGAPIVPTNTPEIDQDNQTISTSRNETNEKTTPPNMKQDNTARVKEHYATGEYRQAQLDKQLKRNEAGKVKQNPPPQIIKDGSNVTISTGKGNDHVEITKGKDGHVHINVNDKEVWQGTPEEFGHVKVDTGAGNDVVRNSVDGANIQTGKGDDAVINHANNTRIDTGEGRDQIGSYGSNNTINSGSGRDAIESQGDNNSIKTGADGGSVRVDGSVNNIDITGGKATVQIQGSGNIVSSNDGSRK